MRSRIREHPGAVFGARGTILPLLFLFAVSALPCIASAQISPDSSVLIISSSNQGDPWTVEVTEGILSVLGSNGHAPKIFYEYIDADRVDAPGYQQKLYEVYRIKYADMRFDAVVGVDDYAYQFLLLRGNDLFPGIPVVCCGVNYLETDRPAHRPTFTGIAEPVEIAQTLDTALALHPGVQQVLIVNDRTETGVANSRLVREVIAPYQESISFTILDNMTRRELEQTLSTLPGDSIVLFMRFSRDRSGVFFDSTESLGIVTESSVRPVYSLWDYTLGRGVVGGMLLRGKDHGVRAALALLEAQGTPVSTPQGNQSGYMFDFEIMRRFGIRITDLPQGSMVINEPASMFAFSWYIWGSIAVATVLIGIIVLLLFNISRRQQAEELLREREEKFRGITQRAFEMIFTANTEGVITYTSPAIQKITGYAPEEIVGENIQKILPESEIAGIQRVLRSVLRGANIDEYEMKLTRKNGSTAIVETNFSPIVENGEINELQGTARDITEKKETEQMKKRAFQQIEKNIEQFQILNDKLRNPLAVIIGLSDLQDSTTSKQIQEQAWQINEIVTQLDKGCIESEKVRAYLRRTYEKE